MALLKIDEKMITENCYGFNESEWADWKKRKRKMSDNKRSESDLSYSILICNMHDLDRFVAAALDSTKNVDKISFSPNQITKFQF